jgi:hypothetical protein
VVGVDFAVVGVDWAVVGVDLAVVGVDLAVVGVPPPFLCLWSPSELLSDASWSSPACGAAAVESLFSVESSVWWVVELFDARLMVCVLENNRAVSGVAATVSPTIAKARGFFEGVMSPKVPDSR